MHSVSSNLFSSFPKVELSLEEDERSSQAWDFPSDHLPVAGQVGRYRIGTFNLLNTKFIDLIINPLKNNGRPGWSDSPLAKKQKALSQENSKLTEREEEICTIIQNLLFENNEREPLDVLCLQECSDSMIEALREKLKTGQFEIIESNGGQNNEVAVIVNTSLFSIVEKRIETAFKRQTNSLGLVPDTFRPVVALCLRELKPASDIAKVYKVVTAHISSAGAGDEYKIERLKEVKNYLEKPHEESDFTILTGDLNSEPRIVNSVFENYENLSSHYTQIENKSPYYMTLIDHILVSHHEEIAPTLAPVTLEDLTDLKASEIYKKIFEPIVKSRQEIIS